MSKTKEISFRHVLVYLWLVGMWPTLVVVGLMALGIWGSIYFEFPLLSLVGIFLSLPLGVAMAVNGGDKFYKRYPQYSKNAA